MSASLLRLPAVLARTGLSRSTLYRLMQSGEFPRPISVAGTRIAAWPSGLVDEWVANQIQPQPNQRETSS